jgi:hypothetical protein
MKPSEEIREIWFEMKELKRLTDHDCYGEDIKHREYLMEKYEHIDILFGHESTLSKAIIFYQDQNYEQNNKKGN